MPTTTHAAGPSMKCLNGFLPSRRCRCSRASGVRPTYRPYLSRRDSPQTRQSYDCRDHEANLDRKRTCCQMQTVKDSRLTCTISCATTSSVPTGTCETKATAISSSNLGSGCSDGAADHRIRCIWESCSERSIAIQLSGSSNLKLIPCSFVMSSGWLTRWNVGPPRDGLVASSCQRTSTPLMGLALGN